MSPPVFLEGNMLERRLKLASHVFLRPEEGHGVANFDAAIFRTRAVDSLNASGNLDSLAVGVFLESVARLF